MIIIYIFALIAIIVSIRWIVLTIVNGIKDNWKPPDEDI
jgi:hypothetical protein